LLAAVGLALALLSVFLTAVAFLLAVAGLALALLSVFLTVAVGFLFDSVSLADFLSVASVFSN